MRDLRTPDLTIGDDRIYRGGVPIDAHPAQKPQTDVGIGRTFIDTSPRVALPIVSPFRARPVVPADGSFAGSIDNIPFRKGSR